MKQRLLQQVLLTFFFVVFVQLLSFAQTLSTNTVGYKVTYDPATQYYSVWVVPNYSTPNANNSLTSERGATAQVSLKVPSGFTITEVIDVRGTWDKPGGALQKLGPNENPTVFGGQGLDATKSYYIIGKNPSETTYGQFTTGVQVELFRFKGNGCFGVVEVLAKTDPFVTVANTIGYGVTPSFYSASGQPAGGNQDPLEQYLAPSGNGANCFQAVANTYTATSGTPTTQSVLGNDTFNGAPLTASQVNVTVTGNPTNGTASPNPDGTITYTPNPGFTGTDTYTYQICDKLNPTVCTTATVTVTVACPTIAEPTVITPVTYCQGATASPLSATAPNGTSLRWYTLATGGTASTTAPTPSTSTAGTTLYYVSTFDPVSGCESARKSISVVINAAPAAPTASSPVVYCQGTTATPLQATPASGSTLFWYTSATATVGSATAPTPSTTTTGTTSYYVSSVSSATCESLTRTQIDVVVNAAPAAPTVSTPVTLCQGATASQLTAGSAAGTTLRWYGTSATGGTAQAVAPTPSTTTAGTTSYYVATVNTATGCESLTRSKIDVIVNAAPAAPTATSPVTYCQGATASPLTATAAANSTLLWWGTSATGGTSSTTAPTPSTATAGTTSFYVSQVNTTNGCESLTRTKIDVIVNAAPAAPTATSPVTVCQGATATALTATAPAGSTLAWYTTATGGTGSATAPTPSTATAGTTSYYVSSLTTPGSCESLTRTQIDVVVNAAPAAPTVVSPVTYCQGATALQLTASSAAGTTLRWYGTDATGGTAQAVAPTPSTTTAGTTSYYVATVNTATGCESLTRSKIDVIVNAAPAAPTATSPVTVCQGATASQLTATAAAGTTLKWWGTSATGGTSSTTAPTPSTATAGTTSYYVSATNTTNGCESLTRTKIDVIVNAAPTAPTATTPVTYCQGATATALTATAPAGSSILWWGTSATGGTSSTLAPTPTTTTVGTTSYYVSAVNTATGCESLTRTKIDVTVTVCRVIYAFNDNNTTPVNTTVSGSTLTNDQLNNGTPTLVVSTTPVAQPTNGTVTLNADGTYSYTPSPNFTGTDTFRYRVCDSGSPAACDTATVTIDIYSAPSITANDKPIAMNDINSTTKGVSVTGNVLSNDIDPDAGQTLTVTKLTNPTNGTVTLNPDGTYTYVPNPGFVGDDTFTYQICDNGTPQLCDQATVQITVKDTPQPGTNLPPVAVDDQATTPSGVPTTGNLLTNDKDPEGTPLTISTTPVKQPTNGTVTINPDGTYTYTPTPGFVGTDSFVYSVCDAGSPQRCSQATAYIQVSAGKVSILPKAYLQGALFGVTLPDVLMRDDLRAKNLVPLSSPYPGQGFVEISPSGTTTTTALAVTGSNAIVDWVFVELRNATNPSQVVDSRSALIQRDGDIVDVDGVTPLTFSQAQPASYFVAVKHRNHLGVMTKTALPLSAATTTIDFRQTSTPTYTLSTGIADQAQVVVQQGVALWAGNALYDNKVIYQGTSNDVNSIYQTIITSTGNVLNTPFFKLRAYNNSDINMNGEVIFQGTGNDVEYIYLNVIKNHPGNVLKQNFFIIREQLP